MLHIVNYSTDINPQVRRDKILPDKFKSKMIPICLKAKGFPQNQYH